MLLFVVNYPVVIVATDDIDSSWSTAMMVMVVTVTGKKYSVLHGCQMILDDWALYLTQNNML